MPRKSPARRLVLVCQQCTSDFATFTRKQKYCSVRCRRLAYRPYFAAYHAANRHEIAAYHREWYRANRERRLDLSKAYNRSESGKALRRRVAREMRERYPEKFAARQAVRIALRKKELTRTPCVSCGNPRSQAHHPDYSKPLDVVWLCARCHASAHSESLYAVNGKAVAA
jgi:hypothetical protein